MGASVMSLSQPPWAHPTPWRRSSIHRQSGMLCQTPGTPSRRAELASRKGTMPVLGLGRDLDIRGPWGTSGWQGGPYQGLLQMLLTSFPS